MRQINGRCSDKRTLAELLPEERPPSPRLSVEMSFLNAKTVPSIGGILENRQPSQNEWIDDRFQALTSCWDYYAVRVRRRNHPATANINSTSDVGSGTAAEFTGPDAPAAGMDCFIRQRT